jgi:hypothetical protein
VNFSPFATPTMHMLMIPTFAIRRRSNVIFVIFTLKDVDCRSFEFGPYCFLEMEDKFENGEEY